MLCSHNLDKNHCNNDLNINKFNVFKDTVKLVTATQYGPSSLNYKCVFEIDQPSDVKWHVNGLNIDGNSEFFLVTNYYDVIDMRQISTMQIMHPSVAYNGYVDCGIPDHSLFNFETTFPGMFL